MVKREVDPIVLIPSLEPDKRLLTYVQQLRSYGLKHIIIVDDGSGEEYQSIFQELRKDGCILLRHEENRGKGAALKTGFRFIGQHWEVDDSNGVEASSIAEDSTDAKASNPGVANRARVACVVTADSDGQHAAVDVYRLAEEAKRFPDALILGVRDFSREGIPAKSLVGNRLTSFLFALLYGKWLPDTQTGLRSFGPSLLAWMQELKGSHFEYELQMLISCIQFGIPIHTVPIQVIYENKNKGSHFQAFRDSIRVMRVLFTNFAKQFRKMIIRRRR